jgi:hypothetical protein
MDGTNGRFEQSRAASDPKRPGFGEGYRAGHRLANIETCLSGLAMQLPHMGAG